MATGDRYYKPRAETKIQPQTVAACNRLISTLTAKRNKLLRTQLFSSDKPLLELKTEVDEINNEIAALQLRRTKLRADT